MGPSGPGRTPNPITTSVVDGKKMATLDFQVSSPVEDVCFDRKSSAQFFTMAE
jgi:hypothetical protein